jgi:hypothetical protein
MNTGIQDAYNLGWKLAPVVSGSADPGLLDSCAVARSRVDTTGRTGHVRAGDRAPDAPCRDAATGATRRLFDVSEGPHFMLLGFGKESTRALHAGLPEVVTTCLVSSGLSATGTCDDGLIADQDYARERMTLTATRWSSSGLMGTSA